MSTSRPTATSAWAAPLKVVPDLVLLDVHLPGMSGFETAASLRQASATRGVPLLFLSGTDDLATRVRDIQLKHVDFMPKPFALDELLVRIDQALGHSHARRQLLRAAEHDELTGLGNLRMLHRSMLLERSRFARYGHPARGRYDRCRQAQSHQ